MPRLAQIESADVMPSEHSSASISLCMIARDAENSLAKSLASAKPFVDEIIVVDTGSLDRTPSIATEMGARVFHLPWADDFSVARNHSIEQATGDWIVWMDADHE